MSLGSFGSNSCFIHFDVLQCILNGFSCCTLLPIQEKGIGIVSYLLESKLRLNCLAPLLIYDQKMSTSGSSARNLPPSQGGRMTMMPMSANRSVFFIYYLFILHLPHRIDITERKWKIYIYIITKIAQFIGQEKLEKKLTLT